MLEKKIHKSKIVCDFMYVVSFKKNKSLNCLAIQFLQILHSKIHDAIERPIVIQD